MPLGKTKFETEMLVRPDDIDMNQHVHGSRYQDYVLAARYDQMARCYQMSMEEFIKLGLGWFTITAHIEYKRQLQLGDRFIVHVFLQVCLPEVIMCETKIWIHFDRLLTLSDRFVIRMRNCKQFRQIGVNDKR